GLPDALRAIALDYVSFLQALGQQRTLLERHCYLVVPDRHPGVPAISLGMRLRDLLAWVGSLLRRLLHPRTRVQVRDDDPTAISASVARRLQAQTDLVARQLGRSGLRTGRLDSHQIAELLHRCWSPELARVQRLRDELGGYLSLVVSSRRQVR